MYYPKSQIKTNLYTNGNEFLVSTTNQPYQGYYYEISTGQQYTGRNPQDGPNINLNPIQEDISYDPTNKLDNPNFNNIIQYYGATSVVYDSVTNTNTNQTRSIPLFNPTLPTSQDIQNGQFNRYFCKKNNEVRYLEIDQNTYKQLQNRDPKIAWDLYTPQSLVWYIKGDKEKVYITNRNLTLLLEQQQQWYGFSQYLKEDFSKYLVS
jgi:hypothetical protein